MSHPQPPGTASFTIDLERAPQAIKDLEQAQAQLVELKAVATQLGNVVPPARDQVSLDAAAALGAIAVGGTGSLAQTLDAGIAHIGELVHSLRQEVGSYSVAEANNDRLLKS